MSVMQIVIDAKDQASKVFRNLAGEIKRAGDTAQETWKSVGERATGIGGKMAMGITTPLTAVGAVGLNAAMQFEQANQTIQGALGVTSEKAQELGGVAKELWKEGWGESVDEAARSVVMIRQNFEDLSDVELYSLTEQAYALRDAFGYEVNESVRAASTMSKQFGIDGSQAMDIISKTAQMAGDKAEDLLDTFNEYSVQFQEMGYDVDEFAGILVKGAQDGAFNFDKVADAVKEFNIRIRDGSDTTKEAAEAVLGMEGASKMFEDMASGAITGSDAMEMLSKQLAAIEDPLKREQLGVALFGTQWEDVGDSIMISMAEGADALGEFEGTANEVRDAVGKGLAVDMTTAGRQIQSALTGPMEIVAGILVESVIPAVKSAAEWFSNLDPVWQKVALGVGTVLAVLPMLILTFGMLATGISSIIALAPAIAGAWAVITGPVGLVVAAIAGLIAIGVLLVKNWNSIKAAALSIWTSFADAMTKIWDGVTKAVTGTWEGIKKFLSKTWEDIKEFGVKLWEAYWELVEEIWGGIFDLAKGIWSSISQFFGQTWDNIKRVAEDAWESVSDFLQSAWRSIQRIAEDTWDGIYRSIGRILDRIRGVFRDVWDDVRRTVERVWDGMVSGIRGSVNRIIDAMNGMIRGLNRIRFSVPDWVPIIGGSSWRFSVPTIPRLHTGGIFRAPRPGGEGLALLKDGERVTQAGTIESDRGQVLIDMRGLFEGAVIYVRDRRDAKMLAEELYTVNRDRLRSVGVKA